MSPPRPLFSAFSSGSVSVPEKQRSISCPTGSDPERSGVNGPSPSRPLLTSM